MKTRDLPTEEGLWDKRNIQALRKTLQSHLSLPQFLYPNHVPPGYHQVSFNSLPDEHELSHDGAEQRHAPNDEWRFRVWAGGFLEFQKPFLWTDGQRGPVSVAVNEKITDTRLIGDANALNAKVMVTLTKSLFEPELDAQGQPVRGNGNEICHSKARHNILLREEKYLCFMREIPDSLKSASPARRIAFPLDSDYSQTMIPSATLLFRFSALTRNAHVIHLDGEYTRQVYGLPRPLVHGPLTSVLMLDVLGEALPLHNTGQPSSLAIRSFQYRNLLPLFVNEPITIACKKLHDVKPDTAKYQTNFGLPLQKWDVWIQKGTGRDATLAVRGSALVSPVTSPVPEQEEHSFI
jgi:hydroxyacyl-ACP dehydratase HTD2-like protein with hotdog domain